MENQDWLVPESKMLQDAINDMRSKIVFFRVDLIPIRRGKILVKDAKTLAQLNEEERTTLAGIAQTQQIIKDLFTELDNVRKKEAENAETIK